MKLARLFLPLILFAVTAGAQDCENTPGGDSARIVADHSLSTITSPGPNQFAVTCSTFVVNDGTLALSDVQASMLVSGLEGLTSAAILSHAGPLTAATGTYNGTTSGNLYPASQTLASGARDTVVTRLEWSPSSQTSYAWQVLASGTSALGPVTDGSAPSMFWTLGSGAGTISLALGPVEDLGGNSFGINGAVTVTNTGSLPLTSVQATVDATVLEGLATAAILGHSGPLTNAAWNGDGTPGLYAASQTLPTGGTDVTSFRMTWDPTTATNATLAALLAASSASGAVSGSDSDPISWTLGTASMALSIQGGAVEALGGNTFAWPCTLSTSATGTEELTLAQTTIDFAPAIEGFTGVSSVAHVSGPLTVSGTFDGDADPDVYPGTGTIPGGQTDRVAMVVEFAPTSATSATVSASSSAASALGTRTANASTGISWFLDSGPVSGVPLVVAEAGKGEWGIPFAKGDVTPAQLANMRLHRGDTQIRSHAWATSLWEDGSVRWALVSGKTDGAETLGFRTPDGAPTTWSNVTLTSPDFQVDVDLDSYNWPAAGSATETFSCPTYAYGLFTIDASATTPGLEVRAYHQVWYDGTSRTGLVLWNKNPVVSGSSGYKNRWLDFDGDPPADIEFEMGIQSTTPFRIRRAPNIYSNTLVDADVNAKTSATLWFDGMMDWTGAQGTFPDTQIRPYHKVGWRISQGTAPIQPYAYVGLVSGENQYATTGALGEIVAPFRWTGGSVPMDSLDIYYEQQVQTFAAACYPRYITTPGAITLWRNPRFRGAGRDWDTSGDWRTTFNSMAEEYEFTHGIALQFMRLAPIVDAHLPTTTARYLFEMADEFAFAHATIGFSHNDDRTAAVIPGREWTDEFQMAHPTHGSSGIPGAGYNQGNAPYPDQAHFNGRCLRDLWWLTGDRVVQEQYEDLSIEAYDKVFCAVNSSTPGGSCGQILVSLEERGPANFIWLLTDWGDAENDDTFLDLAIEFAMESTVGFTPPAGTVRNRAYLYGSPASEKKPWMLARMIRAQRDLGDVLERRGRTADATAVRGYAALLQDWIEAHGIDNLGTFAHGGRMSYFRFSENWTSEECCLCDNADNCPSCPPGAGGPGVYGGQVYYPSLNVCADSYSEAWGIEVGEALNGRAEPALCDELVNCGVYYGSDADNGLPTSFFRILVQGIQMQTGGRYLTDYGLAGR